MKNINIKERTLDFSNCQYLGEVHEIIKNELELPDFYGCNLDALWDSVTGLMYVPAKIKIIFKPENSTSAKLAKYIEEIICVFKDAQSEYKQIELIVEK